MVRLETAKEVLPPRLLYRFHFAWMALGAIVPLVICSLGVLIHALFKEGLKTFHLWAGWWGRWSLAWMGIRVEVEHRGVLDPNTPYVFVPNHQNALDILVTSGYIPVPFGFLAKVELKTAPLMGWVLQKFCIFVDRSTARKAIESVQAAGEMVRNGHSVLIFPEGERTWSNHMVVFMRGAFDLALSAGVPIVPITLIDNYQHLDEWRYVGKPGKIKMILHEPIPTAHLSRKDLSGLMEQVKDLIQSAQPER